MRRDFLSGSMATLIAARSRRRCFSRLLTVTSKFVTVAILASIISSVGSMGRNEGMTRGDSFGPCAELVPRSGLSSSMIVLIRWRACFSFFTPLRRALIRGWAFLGSANVARVAALMSAAPPGRMNCGSAFCASLLRATD